MLQLKTEIIENEWINEVFEIKVIASSIETSEMADPEEQSVIANF